MLDSGRPLLLVNKKAGAYSYSDLMERDDISRSFKIIGYADEIPQEEQQALTAGLRLLVGVQPQPGDTRVTPATVTTTQVPTDNEQRAWTNALSTLTAQQSALCGGLPEPHLVQPCLAEHIIMQALTTKSGAAICASFYIPDQRAACETRLAQQITSAYVDANNNSLIDLFEQYAIPPDQRTNPLNLPVVDPSV